MQYFFGALLRVLLAVGVACSAPPVLPASGAEQTAHRQVIITIKGMMCASCGREIEKTLSKVAGVVTAKVDLPNDRAAVIYDPRRVTPHQLAEAIRKSGYEAIPTIEPP
jgi:copper chaperone CopZ